jgi:hypothetical protein
MILDSDNKLNRYSSLRPIYSINVLAYKHFRGDDDALRIFELYDPQRDKTFNKELLKIGFFEITKSNIETENQRHWRDYFVKSKVSDNAPEYIKKAVHVIDFSNLS